MTTLVLRERDGLVVNHFRHQEGSSYRNLGWHTDSLRDVFYFERPRRYGHAGADEADASRGCGSVCATHRRRHRA